jgi:hypothetical protein
MYRYRVRPSGLTYNVVKTNAGWFTSDQERPQGAAHPNWKGDEVGYNQLHRWVRRNRVKPLTCERCGEERPLDWANKSHEYRRDLDDWLALCRFCHWDHDRGQRGVATRKYGAAGLQGRAS